MQLVQPGPTAAPPAPSQPLWSDETHTVANLPEHRVRLEESHGGCTMQDGAPVSVSGALLLGLQIRVVMEPEGRLFRESFSPFWPEQDGAARFQQVCDEWRVWVVRALEMCERQGILKCPADRDHSAVLSALDGLLEATEWAGFVGWLQRKAVASRAPWLAAQGLEVAPP